jgi:hypothetical protein
VCLSAWQIRPEDARRLVNLAADPIPFMRRFGCLALFLVVFFWALITVVFVNPFGVK